MQGSAPISPEGFSGSFTVVGIGASAGGLEACRRLLDALPQRTGMAFILVQHLDPTHESMMVDLLASHTGMVVRQVIDKAPVEPDQLVIIPPGTYLSVAGGALHLSPPGARHGARLPFDFLLQSMAESYGPRAVCVVLSGTGGDGSAGLRAIAAQGGHVIAQDPEEAGFDGMPLSAIMTGEVDAVLPVAAIPAALLAYAGGRANMPPEQGRTRAAAPVAADAGLVDEIIALLRAGTAHDFTLYKPGTMRRRVERRMAMAPIQPQDMRAYLGFLRDSEAELELLAKDLLINVTSFFRDTKVFEVLAETILPELVRAHAGRDPLRVWIAGCSTGEEAYSLAMLFHEQPDIARRGIALQFFASDIDPDAIALAREGLYPLDIEASVSPQRLVRFFSREANGYRILPAVRAEVVFTVQDVLVDPPFSRLHMVTCRNLLIYLKREAQARVLALFHFALRDNAILLLGNSETISQEQGHFEVISKSARIFRRLGRGRSADFISAMAPSDGSRFTLRQQSVPSQARHAALGDLCRRLVLEAYAPAAVLINLRHEVLYTLGPSDRYLRVPPGPPTLDVLAMARPSLRGKLRAAIEEARRQRAKVTLSGGQIEPDGQGGLFNIEVRPVPGEEPELLLLCFVDDAAPDPAIGAARPDELPRVAALERELEATRVELRSAARNLEQATEEQTAINEEAHSVNEEYQSTNEELLASKEELQSMNEELTALNGQLQETLERQRTTANDLQNVLYSTAVATLFLDTEQRIRFFTPATRALFNVIPGDIGRPLADLNALAADDAFARDVRAVIARGVPQEHEIEVTTGPAHGTCYLRRIMPYRTQDDGVEGVVITFTDITERKQQAQSLEEARRRAELADNAKSRFLAVASHDLRQPLQTLALLQGALGKLVQGEPAQRLIARLDETLASISGMLNSLLDVNQIETGTVQAETVVFPIGDLLDRLRQEFTDHARARGLTLHVVGCGAVIRSDPRLLEQMIRNLLSNALKYTRHGKILVGCRRRSGTLSIEVCDTGAGIPDHELQAIFEEYHQLDNASRERGRGLGLGLSIVQRLGLFLGHPVHVRSRLGHGSVFAIDILPLDIVALAPSPQGRAPSGAAAALTRPARAAAPSGESGVGRLVLVVEDDAELRELLEDLLRGEGHRTVSAADGPAAIEMVGPGGLRPDLVLTDYTLPFGMNGLMVAARLRRELRRQVPVIVLTGQLSAETLGEIARQDTVRLNKPIRLDQLVQVIARLLPQLLAAPEGAATAPTLQHLDRQSASVRDGLTPPVIFIVDDDPDLCDAVRTVFEQEGRIVRTFATAEAYLAAGAPPAEGCLLIDAYLPGMSGLDLLRHLVALAHHLPCIMITGSSDVKMAVDAMKSGASDFIEKPVAPAELLRAVARALDQAHDSSKVAAWHEEAAGQLRHLTQRQLQIMEMVLAGHPSKNIAADLGISQRTVENHRAAIMKKTGSKSIPALARLALAASSLPQDRAGAPEMSETLPRAKAYQNGK